MKDATYSAPHVELSHKQVEEIFRRLDDGNAKTITPADLREQLAEWHSATRQETK